MQAPGGLERARDVVAAVDEHGRDPDQAVHVEKDLVLAEEAVVAPVVGDEPREHQLALRLVAVAARLVPGDERDVRVLPGPPRLGGVGAHERVRVGQQPGVRTGDAAVGLDLGHERDQPLPLTREHAAHLTADPVDLPPRPGRHRSEHDPGHVLGEALRVGERQRRPPRQPEQQPPVDAEPAAQPLHVGDQMQRGVDRQVDVDVRHERPAAPTAALIEQHASVRGRIEEPTLARAAAAARAAMHEQRRQPVGVADRLPVDLLAGADIEHPVLVRLDRRVLVAHVSSIARAAAGEPARRRRAADTARTTSGVA